MDKFDEALAQEVHRYGSLFISAWNDLKEDLAKGIVNYPDNEHELRSLLFAKCLELMKKEGFTTPYQIHAEDIEIYGGDKVDLTLGDLKEYNLFGRAVTVEMKIDPSSGEIISDIKKLQRYVDENFSENRLFHAFFVAMGDITLEKLRPTIVALSIAEEDVDMDPSGIPSSTRRKLALCVRIS